MQKGRWIWYPGDFEIYHGMLQNLSREERKVMWPAFWRIDDCRKNVKFAKEYILEEDTEVTIYCHKQGYILAGGIKHPFGQPVFLKAGRCRIEVFCCAAAGLPAILAEGDKVYSDETWMADDYTGNWMQAGISSYYTKKEQNPDVWEYEKREYIPVCAEQRGDGVLYDFGEELTAEVVCSLKDWAAPVKLCYGESKKEALDAEECYYSQVIEKNGQKIPRRAFRYIFIPETEKENVVISAVHEYVDYPSVGKFHCEDERMNHIWEIAERTFKLCSGIFFIDGVKRDKWIWSGDAYQSYFINQYLMFDEEIEKRTILALRGNDPVTGHINTIVDYSMYWIISIYNHYMATADNGFAGMVLPKVKSMMQFLENGLDENGFITGREDDWTFIDWADIDKEGPVCAEQMLLAQCWKTMDALSAVVNEDGSGYKKKYENLVTNINTYYWDNTKGAYIDSFVSGARHITKHANIFALLFGVCNEKQRESIFENVIFSDKVDKITTPYFKFFELEALCLAGKYADVKAEIESYWGSMERLGMTTFWEEYDPEKPLEEQYGMYGDPYGKSLCHAWAGTPVYLLGRHFIGVRPLEAGYVSFEVVPKCEYFETVDCVVPIKGGKVRVYWDKQEVRVSADRDGGILKCLGKEIELRANVEVRIERG